MVLWMPRPLWIWSLLMSLRVFFVSPYCVSSNWCGSFLEPECRVISRGYVCICRWLPLGWRYYHCHPSVLGVNKVHHIGLLCWIQLWDSQGVAVHELLPSLFTSKQRLDSKFFIKVFILHWCFIELCKIVLASNCLICINLYGVV
jgi:hypothetical protein